MDSEPVILGEKERVEYVKMMCDHLKHAATLSAGSILILALMLEKLFGKPHLPSLVPVAFVALFMSLAVSLLAYASLVLAVARACSGKPMQVRIKFTLYSLLTTWIAFVTGVGVIALFFIMNWIAHY